MIRWLNERFEECLAVILLALIVIFVCANVVARYLLNASLPWGEELVGWIFIWFIWVAVSYVFRLDKHIEITFLRDMLPAAAQRYLLLLVQLAVVGFLVTISIYSIDLMLSPMVRNQVSVVLQMPIPIYYAAAPAGAILSSFRILQNCWSSYKELRNGTDGGAV